MEIRLYASEGRWKDPNFSHVLYFHEEDGSKACASFKYGWDVAEWQEEYSALKELFKTKQGDYRNWRLSKQQYRRHIKEEWLERASDFVEELCSGEREMVPVDLRVMFHDARKLVGYPVYAWPGVCLVKHRGSRDVIYPVEWDVFGRPL